MQHLKSANVKCVVLRRGHQSACQCVTMYNNSSKCQLVYGAWMRLVAWLYARGNRARACLCMCRGGARFVYIDCGYVQRAHGRNCRACPIHCALFEWCNTNIILRLAQTRTGEKGLVHTGMPVRPPSRACKQHCTSLPYQHHHHISVTRTRRMQYCA